jgi:hypothetical protein
MLEELASIHRAELRRLRPEFMGAFEGGEAS